MKPDLSIPEGQSSPDSSDLLAAPEFRPRQPLGVAYFWLVAFFLVYCGRPEDWIPGLTLIPLAKVVGVLALISFFASLGRLRRGLPREMIYLILLFVQLWFTVPLSTVWRGGAFDTMLDFSKVLLIMLVMTAAVTTLGRLRRLIFVQAACVVTIAAVSLAKGELELGRLEGAVNGLYANPNELAMGLVLTLPLCLALLLRTRNPWRRAFWTLACLLLVYVTMLTGSRAGLLALVVSGVVCLWEFGFRGKRPFMLVTAGGIGLVVILLAGGTVKDRFDVMFNDRPTTDEQVAAHDSAVERRELFWKSLQVTAENPLFGVGPGNFVVVSGHWRDQHNSYTQMSSEGGLPALILYLMILWRAFANLRQTKKLAPAKAEATLFAMALRASLGGFLVGSFFTTAAYQFFPYFLVGYTTALAAIVKTGGSGDAEARDTAQLSDGTDQQYAAAPIAG